MPVQLKALKRRSSRIASESEKNDRISTFKARESILKRVNSIVSFTVIFFTANIY